MPGLIDTGGDMMEYINMFMIKAIFQKAKKIRFIIPITHYQLHNDRGMLARELLRKIQGIFSHHHHTMADYMLPIVTKCKTGDDEVDIDEFRILLKDQLRNEIQA